MHQTALASFALMSLLAGAEEAKQPRPLRQTITVTASRANVRIADAPSSTVVVSGEELANTAVPTVDDALRSVPGFSLFRRSGSRTANPTSQGVSLRGVGASGASRAAVLDDGVPLNDAFGGWVYWGRVPVTAIDRVEVVRGGASDLFGGSASSGVIQLVRTPATPGFVADLSFGGDETSRVSASGAIPAGGGVLRDDSERFSTAGYVPVAPAQRGPVDAPAGVTRGVADLGWSRAGDRAFFARVSRFEENRDNGTPLQRNSTELWSAAAGLDAPAGPAFLSLRAFATDQDYEQTFSAIAADRSSERLTRSQEVPSRSLGVSAAVTLRLGRAATLVAGGEARRAEGRSDESVFAGDVVNSVSAGGTQRTASLFAETVTELLTALTMVASVRYDTWNNGDASRSFNGSVTHLPERDAEAWSPRLALLYRLSDEWSVTSSAYTAFRAPSLNELYRSFRVGNVVTNANDALDAERVRGLELGARYRHGALSLRANLFSLTTSDSIANVTLSVTPELITRERRNVGRTRSRGLEIDAETTISPRLTLSAGYLFADSVVLDFDENPRLVGRRLPQVPRHQGSLRVTWRPAAGALVAADLRHGGAMFEDDLNDLVLSSYTTLDLFASLSVTPRWTAYAALENATGEPIESARTPVVALGQPRTWRVGGRFRRSVPSGRAAELPSRKRVIPTRDPAWAGSARDLLSATR